MKKLFLWQVLLGMFLLLGGCAEKQQQVITDPAEIPGVKVGAVIGSLHVELAKKAYPNAQIQTYDSYTDLLYALRNHKLDAIVELETCWKAQQKDANDVVVIDDRWYVEQFGMIFNKNNPELLTQYNTFLKGLKESGEWQKIVDKWHATNGEATMPDLSDIPRTGKPLRVACTGTFPFYDYVKAGKHCGFDIEFVERFAAYLHRPVEYIMMNFGGLIAAVSSNVADIGTGNICITEERAKQVNFGDCYGESASYLLIRKENAPAELLLDSEPVVEEKSFWQGICESFDNNLIQEDRWKLIVDGMWNTILISVFSILFGTLLGTGVCAMRMSKRGFLSTTAKGYIDLIRGIPVLVLLMILYYVVFAQLGVSALIVAIITFSLSHAAYTSEMFRSGLGSIDPGQRKAGIAMGFTDWQTFRYIILPQTVKRVLPIFKGESISLVKTTSIVGYIAVTDLTKASDLIRSRTFDAFFPLIVITIIYFILAWSLGKLLDLIGKTIK